MSFAISSDCCSAQSSVRDRMRWYRTDEMDLLPTEPPPFRSDRLRQHVDRLPQPERTIVSRHYFGQEPIRTIAGEVGITEPEAKRCLANALRILKVRVERDHKALLKDEAAIRALSATGIAGAGEVVSSAR